MNNPNKQTTYLMTREDASTFLGIDPKSFDKFVRSNSDLKRFMIGTHERFTAIELKKFIDSHVIDAH